MSTILIDGDLVVYRLTSAAETEIDWGNDMWTLHSDAKSIKVLFEGEVLRLQKKFKTASVLVCFSDKDNFRRKVDPSYKANRTGRKPLAYRGVVEWVKKEYKTMVRRGLEADDCLGLSCRAGDIIVSWDKDMKQIPGKHYNPNTDEITEISPEQGYRYFLTQVLTGDRVDGYAGCPGCGPVKAERLLDAECSWATVSRAYAEAGLEEKDALRQARLAYILKRPTDYHEKSEFVKLWNP